MKEQSKRFRALGLMCGTSADGVDVAVIDTDGHQILAHGAAASHAFDAAFRQRLRDAMKAAAVAPVSVAPPEQFQDLAAELADRHAEAVHCTLTGAGLDLGGIDVVGFHGQTIRHAPDHGFTWQIGDAARLAAALQRPVVSDFRQADVAAGGQGAPFVPLYHKALAAAVPALRYPLAVLNIGGVANVTWIEGPAEADRVIACDTGPGNALLDDWVARHGLGAYDHNGALAATGRADEARLATWLAQLFFQQPAPKSLDRDAFAHLDMAGLDAANGAATLAAFTVAAVACTAALMPAPARQWLVTGGGRHNATLMALLADRLAAPVAAVETAGWRGDVLEAEAFAYLAVRSRLGLPLSLPGTTGVSRPMPGGRTVTP